MKEEEDAFSSTNPSYHILEDVWTVDDKQLQFVSYAYALSRFLTHPRTLPPNYLSIQGPEGFGKTSLMRTLQYNLDVNSIKTSSYSSKQSATIAELLRFLETEEKEIQEKFEVQQPESAYQTVKGRLTIWLSALEYEDEEFAWPILTDTIIKQVTTALPTKERDLLFFRLHSRRQGLEEFRQLVYDRISSYCRKKAVKWSWILPITLIGLAAFMIVSNANVPGISLGLSGIVISAILGIVQILQQRENIELLRMPWDRFLWFISRIKKAPARKILKEYANLPTYVSKPFPTQEMLEDLRTIFEIIPQDFLPLVIFIDDLDLCSPNKIASILETISISFPRRFPNVQFVIGYDREIISSALEVSDNLRINMRSLSERYARKNYLDVRSYLMNRIEQLSIVIPPIEQNYIEKYFESSQGKEKAKGHIDGNQRDDYTIAAKNESDKVTLNITEREREILQEIDTKELDDTIDLFSENNIELLDLMNDTLHFLGRDWKKFVRFEMVFRFHYTLYSGKKASNVQVLSLTQLRDWVLLSLNWSDVVQWLYHEDSPCSELRNGTDTIIDSVRRKLILLEDLASKGWSNSEKRLNDRRWKAEIDEYSILESMINKWLADKCLKRFFDRQTKLKHEDRLSSSKVGLF